jgi:DNA invertase Pin-like site-specific DNA recombinase
MGQSLLKKAVLYARISTPQQNLETQLADLRIMAAQRGYKVTVEYKDCVSGAKAKRPGLDRLLADARDHQFDAVFVAAFDRMARNVRHFLAVVDELSQLGIEFISRRENIDTTGPLGRAVILLVSSLSEIERDLLKDRVRLGMRRARLEGRQIGRAPLNIDRAGLVRDRRAGMSLTKVSKKYGVSRGTVCRIVNLCQAEYHAVDATHLPLGIVKPGPVLVA